MLEAGTPLGGRAGGLPLSSPANAYSSYSGTPSAREHCSASRWPEEPRKALENDSRPPGLPPWSDGAPGDQLSRQPGIPQFCHVVFIKR